jgi:nitrite reductase (NO-forming)
MKVRLGDTFRIYFGNIGPNLDSSVHIIGGILGKVYIDGSLASTPLTDVQTTLVPAGGSVVIESTAETSGVLTLVDHSLFRIHEGALATITVSGPQTPSIFSSIKNGTGPIPSTNVMNMTSQTQTITSTVSMSSNSTVVMILNYAYNPAQITVTAGTTVTWVNQDPVGHTVTEGNADSPKPSSQRVFDSSHGTAGANVIVIPSGQSWSFTFTTSGEYDYYCIPHPYMRGHVSVLPIATSSSQSFGYGDLSNFYMVLTGRELLAIGAFGIVVLVVAILVFSRRLQTSAQVAN